MRVSVWRTWGDDPAAMAARDISRLFAGLPGLQQLVEVAQREALCRDDITRAAGDHPLNAAQSGGLGTGRGPTVIDRLPLRP